MTLARRLTGLERAGGGAFTPTDLVSLVAWFDFSDVSTLWTDTARTAAVTTDTDVIKGVTNKATSPSYHLSEATNGPQYKTGIQNGNSVARFNGTSDLLTTTASIGADSSRTFVLVMRKNSAVGAGSHTPWSLSGDAQLYSNSGSHASGWNYYPTQASAEQLNIIPTATNWNIAVLRLNSASSFDVYANGGTATNFDPHNAIANDLTMCLGSEHGGQFVDIDLGDMLVFDTALAVSDINDLGSYLDTKWSITWTTAS